MSTLHYYFRLCGMRSDVSMLSSRYQSIFDLTHPTHTLAKDSHNTGNFMPYSFRIVCGFSHIELINMEGVCETGPTVYSPYPRRHAGLKITAGHQTMSGQISNLTGQIFYSPVMLTGHIQQPHRNKRKFPRSSVVCDELK